MTTTTIEKPAADKVIEPAAQNAPDAPESKIDYGKYREVLDEKKKMQKKLEEFEKKVDDERQKKLAEDGKLKELLDEKEKQLLDHKETKERLNRYDERTQKEIDGIKTLFSESIQKLLDGFSGSLDEKLDYAKALKEEFGKKSNSKASERVGSEAIPNTIDLKEFIGPAGREKLMKVKSQNPELYKEILKQKSGV
jgi:hypothetical protein